ncbi:MAG: F0F1 ATP synthase subunit B [bacterium]|nr:F0F1 ATP synthase subunit B [bacterium]
MEVLKEFGVQPILLFAQAVNFLVLFLLLRKFLFTPLIRVLDERRLKIQKAMEDTQKAQDLLSDAQDKSTRAIKDAKDEAKLLVTDATKNAQLLVMEAREKTQKDITAMLTETEQKIAKQKEDMRREIKGEVVSLVTLTLGQIVGKVLTRKDEERLIKDSINKLSNRAEN